MLRRFGRRNKVNQWKKWQARYSASSAKTKAEMDRIARNWNNR